MKDIFAGNKRIVILQGLERELTMSNEMAQRLLRVYGHSLALEEVNAICQWLSMRGLVTLEKVDDSIIVMHLTRHGMEVARGYVKEEGVDSPVED